MRIASMASISEAEYSAIENALQATQKGRRFLRAFVERNRSWEFRNLLRSIARLHRAATGAPGLNAEVSRDLASVLRSVARHKRTAAGCPDAKLRSRMLTSSLEEVEANLIALIESLEERAFEALGNGSPSDSCEIQPGGRESLFEEISPHFIHEPR